MTPKALLTSSAEELIGKMINSQAQKLMPEQIVDVVNRHCKLAAGAGLVPVPGAGSRYGVGYGHLATARQPNHFTCSHLWSVIYAQQEVKSY